MGSDNTHDRLSRIEEELGIDHDFETFVDTLETHTQDSSLSVEEVTEEGAVLTTDDELRAWEVAALHEAFHGVSLRASEGFTIIEVPNDEKNVPAIK